MPVVDSLRTPVTVGDLLLRGLQPSDGSMVFWYVIQTASDGSIRAAKVLASFFDAGDGAESVQVAVLENKWISTSGAFKVTNLVEQTQSAVYTAIKAKLGPLEATSVVVRPLKALYHLVQLNESQIFLIKASATTTKDARLKLFELFESFRQEHYGSSDITVLDGIHRVWQRADQMTYYACELDHRQLRRHLRDEAVPWIDCAEGVFAVNSFNQA